MPFIKELIIHGFKSFARETKIPFKNSMNTIVGPNGAGKSNITDAICFVLGRMGSKSMRAKKLSNLIFAGTQKYKPAGEASVELVFDNSDKGFPLGADEVSIKRILRKNGQGIYKINNEIKTRQEVLELLAQAGIDPNGFNIILQGEIDSFVKMPAEQRREVIEEVAGISIYEIRKERSLRELEKTEMRLKEVSATLRERHAHLKNLEEERKQAMHYQKLKADVFNFKASILHKIIQEKQEKLDEINEHIKKHQEETAKISELIDKDSKEISLLNEKISHITNNIQKASGIEQEKLNNEISDLRAELAGNTIKKQTLESQIEETRRRKSEIESNIENFAKEIKEMSKSKERGRSQSFREELEQKKRHLEELDEKKRKFYLLNSNLSSLASIVEYKNKQLQKLKNDSEFVFERIKEIESGLKIRESIERQQENKAKLKISLEKLEKEIEESQNAKNEREKLVAALDRQVQELEKTKEKINSLDVCPLCRTKMTKEHVSKVAGEIGERQSAYKKEIEHSSRAIKELEAKIKQAEKTCAASEEVLRTRAQDITSLESINEKKQNLRGLSEEQKTLENEYAELISKKSAMEKQVLSVKTSEEVYDSLRLEIQELERREEKNLGMEITLKQRDSERLKNMVRQASREIEQASAELAEVSEVLDEKQDALSKKSEQDEMLKRKFKSILDEKNQHQEKIRFFERDILSKQSSKQVIEDKINNLKIERAQIAATKESKEAEASEFKDARILKQPVEELEKSLQETQRILANIGAVNLRSLEVYEGVKQQYEQVQEKANVLLKEKEEILKIIEDIDKKKRKVFLNTLDKLNALFSRNFSQLSTKGIASLEPTEPENLFEGGIEMLIKVGKGKYFDIHSLSGGEKSFVALSLIFAIQEYKPYCFYIFDEIDAALDKHNSEKLSALLKRYTKNGQYILITHNDSLITEAPTIYGVVMQDKISSVISMEV